MAKNNQQPTEGELLKQQSLMIQELVAIIERSQLPEEKKLSKLYLIASGQFSLDDMDRLLGDFKVIGEALETQKRVQELRQEQLLQQAGKAQDKLFDARLESARELEKNAEKLVESLQKEASSQQKDSEIETLQKKLSS